MRRQPHESRPDGAGQKIRLKRKKPTTQQRKRYPFQNSARLFDLVRSGGLRSLPFGPTRCRPWMQWQSLVLSTARRTDWSGPFGRNSHQTHLRLPRPGRATHGNPCVVPREGMIREQSPLKRTIATSRCNDDRNESTSININNIPRTNDDHQKHAATQSVTRTY